MCDVPNSTLRKIDECDLLIADLTYVATSDEIDRETGAVQYREDIQEAIARFVNPPGS